MTIACRFPRTRARTIRSIAFLLVVLRCCRSVGAVLPTAESDRYCGSDDNSNSGDDRRKCKVRRLTPSDLPPPNIFESFDDANTTVSVSVRGFGGDTNGDGNSAATAHTQLTLTAMRGTILQQGRRPGGSAASAEAQQHGTRDGNENHQHRSELVVLPGLLPRSVVAEILVLLRGDENAERADGRTTIGLDQDPDSVDGMTSQEIFLENEELRNGLPSKGGTNANAREAEERREIRNKLVALTEPYAKTILVPFLKQWYGENLCGKPGRNCTPCYSLIRRYRAGERQSHAPHHDAHSFVTVVVSLTDYGKEYNGGLYVSAKNSERNYVKLDRGDAVMHQGDLHHGVRVLDRRDDGGPSERWSWILWFRDSDICEDHSREWHSGCAETGNPTCMYLQATKGNHLQWNKLASDAGHAQASVKLAYAYLKALPSPLEFDMAKAKELFAQAIVSSNEPDGHYGMAALFLAETRMRILNQPDRDAKQREASKAVASPPLMEAIYHLEESAKGGHVFAMFNLGICYTYGYGGTRDPLLAAEWFEASGLPEGLFAKSLYLQSVEREEDASTYRERARILGFGAPWRKPARERTGSGGSWGAKLNLNWPPLPNGQLPPEW